MYIIIGTISTVCTLYGRNYIVKPLLIIALKNQQSWQSFLLHIKPILTTAYITIHIKIIVCSHRVLLKKKEID